MQESRWGEAGHVPPTWLRGEAAAGAPQRLQAPSEAARPGGNLSSPSSHRLTHMLTLASQPVRPRLFKSKAKTSALRVVSSLPAVVHPPGAGGRESHQAWAQASLQRTLGTAVSLRQIARDRPAFLSLVCSLRGQDKVPGAHLVWPLSPSLWIRCFPGPSGGGRPHTGMQC